MNLYPVAAALVFCSVATASVPDAWLRDAQEPPAEAAAVPAAAEEAAPRARVRCTTCGVVEAIRRIEHGGGVPASFEFTVRLRDGSTRTSNTASAAGWRSGDRIMLIGGAAATPVSQL
ncbi:MAG: hypothetical protein Q8R01_16295 [Ramlibacter sp.]|nr:hypothetical protein [Ramlibacter sp.]